MWYQYWGKQEQEYKYVLECQIIDFVLLYTSDVILMVILK